MFWTGRTPIRLLDRLAPRGTASQMPGQTTGGQLPSRNSHIYHSSVLDRPLPFPPVSLASRTIPAAWTQGIDA